MTTLRDTSNWTSREMLEKAELDNDNQAEGRGSGFGHSLKQACGRSRSGAARQHREQALGEQADVQ